MRMNRRANLDLNLFGQLAVLLVLAFSGLSIAVLIDTFVVPLPLYVWPLSFLLLPAAAVGMLLLLDRRAPRHPGNR